MPWSLVSALSISLSRSYLFGSPTPVTQEKKRRRLHDRPYSLGLWRTQVPAVDSGKIAKLIIFVIFAIFCGKFLDAASKKMINADQVRKSVYAYSSPVCYRFRILHFGFSHSASAQDLSLTRPGSLTLFRPFSDSGEGSFTPVPVRISSYGTVGYDDNVFAAHNNPQGSIYTELGLTLGGNYGNQRTALTGNISAGMVGYWQRPGNKIDPNITWDLTLEHQLNERTVLTLSTALSYQSQPDVSTGVGVLNHVGNFLDSENKVSLGFQWSRRVATFTNYSFNVVHYDDSAVAATQDRIEQMLSEEVRYLLLPTVVALTEYQLSYVDYLHDSSTNSLSHTLLAGADLTPSPRLNFGFRAGAELRYVNSGAPSGVLYPYAESTLTYKYGPRASIAWYNRYGLEQPDVGNSGYRKTYRTGLTIAHTLGARTSLAVSVYYSHSMYTGTSPFSEDVMEANLFATYQITRHFSLNAGDTFTRDWSGMLARDYARNRIFCGASYSF